MKILQELDYLLFVDQDPYGPLKKGILDASSDLETFVAFLQKTIPFSEDDIVSFSFIII